jgi:cobalt-zinc-cadmium efflux system membrane fusion protein
MNKMYHSLTLLTLLIWMSRCQQAPLEETSKAFVMSESMMKWCSFDTVQLQPLAHEFRFFGKMEADNNRTAQVFSAVGGLVKSIHIGLGDYVKQGQVLATIQSSEVAHYEKERIDAQNDLATAEKQYQITSDLYAGHLASERDVQLAEMEVRKAKASLKKLDEIYKIYNFKHGSIFPVVAPISGFVISKKVNMNCSVPRKRSPYFRLPIPVKFGP